MDCADKLYMARCKMKNAANDVADAAVLLAWMPNSFLHKGSLDRALTRFDAARAEIAALESDCDLPLGALEVI